MKKTLLFIFLSLIMISCGSKKAGKGIINQEVPFSIAKNYFVKNNVEAAIDNPKFETQQEFEEVFGAATAMGENGKPTAIDFSKQFVVAQIEDPSTQMIELKPVSVRKNANMLEVKYKRIVGDTKTFTSQTSMILVIDKKYDGDVNFVEEK